MRYRNHEYRSIFNKTKSSRKEIKKIYDNEKARYESEEELDIDFEKISLKSSLNNIQNELMLSYLAVLAVSLMCFISILFTIVLNFGSLTAVILSSILLIDMLVMLIYINKFVIKKALKQQLYYEICLKILDKIIDEKKVIKSNEIIKQ